MYNQVFIKKKTNVVETWALNPLCYFIGVIYQWFFGGACKLLGGLFFIIYVGVFFSLETLTDAIGAVALIAMFVEIILQGRLLFVLMFIANKHVDNSIKNSFRLTKKYYFKIILALLVVTLLTISVSMILYLYLDTMGNSNVAEIVRLVTFGIIYMIRTSLVASVICVFLNECSLRHHNKSIVEYLANQKVAAIA